MKRNFQNYSIAVRHMHLNSWGVAVLLPIINRLSKGKDQECQHRGRAGVEKSETNNNIARVFRAGMCVIHNKSFTASSHVNHFFYVKASTCRDGIKTPFLFDPWKNLLLKSVIYGTWMLIKSARCSWFLIVFQLLRKIIVFLVHWTRSVFLLHNI